MTSMLDRTEPRRASIRAIGLGASTGGPSTLRRILQDIGAAGVPIFIVQHVDRSCERDLANWLNIATDRAVLVARDGDVPQCDTVYLAPADRHMEVRCRRISVTRTPRVSYARPSADVLFTSMARAYGPACICILATGMGVDGASGLAAVRRSGGLTIVEDANTALIPAMPRAALRLEPSHAVLPSGLIGHYVRSLVETNEQRAG